MCCRSCTCSHTPKKVLDSSHATALDADSFDIPSKTHELKDSIKFFALSEEIPADFRSHLLVRTRIRPDSARVDEWRLSPNLQPSPCPRLVFGHVVSTSRGCLPCCRRGSDTDHFFAMYVTPYTSIAMETFQLRFCRGLGYSITEVCFSVTPPWNRILTSHSYLESHHLNGCPSLEVPKAPCTKSYVAFASIT